jgi:RNA polymerase sigma-70 factor (ECF subfamily)
MGAREVAGEDFDRFFSRTLPRLERLATRILGPDPAAEDIAVEALARAYAHWESLCRMDKPEAWVFRVATNLALDLIRRRRPPLAPAGNQLGPGDDAVAVRLALVAALGHLTRRQQEVVVLRYIADLPENEVALSLRMTLGTVKTHLHRAMPKLRDQLGPTFARSDLS